MKIKWFLLISLIMILSACNNKFEKQTTNQEEREFMQWEDAYFMELCSQVFDKPGDQITYEEVSNIEKISYLYVEGRPQISVHMLNSAEHVIINVPENPMKSVIDLIYFKNLNYYETPRDKFIGVEAFKNLTQLKTLVVHSDINNEQLKLISESCYIESLKILFLDVDYSALAQMSNLKIITILGSYGQPPTDYYPLLTLPSENCLIDLGFIFREELTRDLYDLLSTHPNISNIGKLINVDDYDLCFLEDMKNLTTLNISTDDITSISKMTWLKELDVSGNFDPSQLSSLSNLSNLETLSLYTLTEQIITLDFLGNMKKLRELQFYDCIIFSLDGIEDCKQLKSFTCKSGLVEDVNALRSLYQLEYLNLSNNLVTDISVLQSLTKLKYIYLDANEISDITPLKNCVNLEYLCLDGNYVTDIRPLSNLPKLKELQIQVDDPDIKKNIDITSWRNTLQTLPDLKFYAGGVYDGEWIGKYLPNVIHGRSEMQGDC